MSQVSRIVSKIVPSFATPEGAGVIVRRTIGGPKISAFDPFLLLDEFNSDKADDYIEGFPDHPHRGFETVTYMLDGYMEHQDHKGNKGLLGPGGIQWMTAGRGIVHSEMPKQDHGLMRGFQMWVNLPAKNKMMNPRYQDIQAEQIPIINLDNGIKIKLMAGEFNGKKGAIDGVVTSPLYADITVPAGQCYTHPIEIGHNAFVYVFEGEAYFGPKSNESKITQSTLALLEEKGEQMEVRTENKEVRFLLAAAKPINEPIARYGPFVMNTREEIMQAFADYQSGKLQQ